jgi:O-glycosyl hydrolase
VGSCPNTHIKCYGFKAYLPIAGDFTYSDILKRCNKTSNTILDHITVNLIMSPNEIRAFVYWFIEMESELLFIVIQKWNQSFCLLAYRNGIRAFVYCLTEMESSFCLLSYRNGIRAFVYWFIEMESELLFIGL